MGMVFSIPNLSYSQSVIPIPIPEICSLSKLLRVISALFP